MRKCKGGARMTHPWAVGISGLFGSFGELRIPEGLQLANVWAGERTTAAEENQYRPSEFLDIGAELVGQLHLVLALLDVRAVKALDEIAVENRCHRLDLRERLFEVLDQILF